MRPSQFTIVLAAALAACASSDLPQPNDTVKDEGTAIKIGLGKCLGHVTSVEKYRARLRRGVWHVWMPDIGYGNFGVDVTAADGKATDCFESVSSTG
jgi:hypothetical protein